MDRDSGKVSEDGGIYLLPDFNFGRWHSECDYQSARIQDIDASLEGPL